jgi:anaerobic C4-dicarboxylate transporter DcuA
MFWLEFALVLVCILLGSRRGGMGLGAFGGVGLLVMAFVFGARPDSPPIDVMLMILAVVSAASALQAAGGLDYLVELAEGLLRKKPQYITFIAPLITYSFTLAAGTGHTAYSTLPVIAEVARNAGVRPERPMSVAVIASQLGIVACPISAATVSLLGMLAGENVQLGDILMVTIPATFVGVAVAALAMVRYGKPLDQDPIYRERLEKGLIKKVEARPQMAPEQKRRAQAAVGIFLLAALGVVLLGTMPELRPSFEVEGQMQRMGMAKTIEIVMLTGAALIFVICKVATADAIKSDVMRAGVAAVIGIFGIAWLGNTFFESNQAFIVGNLEGLIEAAPWLFALGLFALSILVFSQGATTAALMPVGIALGIPTPYLIAMFPAVCGFFFLPAYGTVLAAIEFDQTGTTRIGKFVVNHSFMVPGLVAVIVSVAVGFVIAGVLL